MGQPVSSGGRKRIKGICIVVEAFRLVPVLKQDFAKGKPAGVMKVALPETGERVDIWGDKEELGDFKVGNGIEVYMTPEGNYRPSKPEYQPKGHKETIYPIPEDKTISDRAQQERKIRAIADEVAVLEAIGEALQKSKLISERLVNPEDVGPLSLAVYRKVSGLKD